MDKAKGGQDLGWEVGTAGVGGSGGKNDAMDVKLDLL